MYKRATIRAAYTINTRQLRQLEISHLSILTLGISSISNAIRKDHRELKQYYNNIICAKDDDDATRWQNQFTWELARHLIGEELVVYPAFDSPGISLAYTGGSQVKEQLKKFQNLQAGSQEFLSTTKSLMVDLRIYTP